ncbi:hypothetical protein B0H14DRAFT_2366990 [Mycena olivaceomarginata]|nr:hypothetical protein B0H14DRAFT_2366990 [Mycena olivaceomarginata]
MASANFTIDDTSPLIQYAGIWRAGSDTDPLGHLRTYTGIPMGGTFTLCNTLGGSATFTFNGTQVYVYGAKRDNHGPYSITLDGTTTTFDGFSETALWTTLFVSDLLAQGLHTVTVTNQMRNSTSAYLDIDYASSRICPLFTRYTETITWTSTVAEHGETTTLEDTASGFSYEPEAAWSTELEAVLLSGFSSGTNQSTHRRRASLTTLYAPQGDVITIFGAVGPSIAPYSVQLDGTPRGTLNATKPSYTPQVALYHADNLGTGLHTLVLTSQPAAERQVLAIDYAQVAAVPQPGSADSRRSV